MSRVYQESCNRVRVVTHMTDEGIQNFPSPLTVTPTESQADSAKVLA